PTATLVPLPTETVAPGELPTATVALSGTVLLIEGENWPAAARITVLVNITDTVAGARRVGEVRANRRGELRGQIRLRVALAGVHYAILRARQVELIVPIENAKESSQSWPRLRGDVPSRRVSVMLHYARHGNHTSLSRHSLSFEQRRGLVARHHPAL
ncbi:MAG: hypothetical protein ACUVRU_02160, partial [Anaerolineae bacterium]